MPTMKSWQNIKINEDVLQVSEIQYASQKHCWKLLLPNHQQSIHSMSINWLCFGLQTGMVDVLVLKVYENGTIMLIKLLHGCE